MRAIDIRDAESEAESIGVRFRHHNRLGAEQSRRHRATARRSDRNRRHTLEG